MTDAPARLVLQNATKSFGPVVALGDGSITLQAGEAHALLGENGAGKSTLVKILGGVYGPDAGELSINGSAVTFSGPADAQAAGVSIIYQEPSLFPDLTVAENIFVGRHPLSVGRRIDRRRDGARGTRGVRPTRRRCSIRPGSLAACRSPTSRSSRSRRRSRSTPRSSSWTSRLQRSPRSRSGGCSRSSRHCATQGAAVLFISHRLEEVFACCQRVTIMRDGRFVRTAPIEEITIDEIIRSMVGRDARRAVPEDRDRARRRRARGFATCAARACSKTSPSRCAEGEIVALAGLVGAGRSEVARAIFGIDRRDGGTVRLNGRELPNGNSRAAMAAGIALVPEDRRQQGLVMDLGIDHNIALASLCRLARGGSDPSARQRAPLGPDLGRTAAAQVRPHPRLPSRRCPVATSRRSCSASGWPATRSC